MSAANADEMPGIEDSKRFLKRYVRDLHDAGHSLDDIKKLARENAQIQVPTLSDPEIFDVCDEVAKEEAERKSIEE